MCSKCGLEELVMRCGDVVYCGGMLLGDGCCDDYSNNFNFSYYCVWGVFELIFVWMKFVYEFVEGLGVWVELLLVVLILIWFCIVVMNVVFRFLDCVVGFGFVKVGWESIYDSELDVNNRLKCCDEIVFFWDVYFYLVYCLCDWDIDIFFFCFILSVIGLGGGLMIF